MSGKRGAVHAKSRLREAKCLELRSAGYTFSQIGEHLGMTAPAAYNAYRRALERLPGVQNREELRQLEAARIDALFRSWWPKALAGEQRAFNNVMRLMERRAKLLGLDGPEEINVQVIFRLIRQLRAMPEEERLRVMGLEVPSALPADEPPALGP